MKMDITEVPDYVELNNDQLLEIISEAVASGTGRIVARVDIFPTLGRDRTNVHAKIYLAKGKS